MLRAMYRDIAVPALKDRYQYSNVMCIPKLSKVSINVGLGIVDASILENVVFHVSMIAGQKPAITRARKSIAGFKIRKGNVLGCRVTLRRDKMYHFLERVLYFAFPRGRDFRGCDPRGFDGRGNFNFGIKEHHVFPEVEYNKIERMFGMDISIETTATTDEEAKFLLTLLDFPFRK